MGAFSDFQKAVFQALNINTALTALIGSGKILDDVPHGGETGAVAFPYVTIGDQSGEDDGASDADVADVSIAIHAWSRGAGRQQSLQMLDAIFDAVHNQSLFVSEGVLVILLYESHETVTEQDRETYHGVIRFRGLYHIG